LADNSFYVDRRAMRVAKLNRQIGVRDFKYLRNIYPGGTIGCRRKAFKLGLWVNHMIHHVWPPSKVKFMRLCYVLAAKRL